MFNECYECKSDGYVREKGVYFLIEFPLLKQSYCMDCHEKLGIVQQKEKGAVTPSSKPPLIVGQDEV